MMKLKIVKIFCRTNLIKVSEIAKQALRIFFSLSFSSDPFIFSLFFSNRLFDLALNLLVVANFVLVILIVIVIVRLPWRRLVE